MRVGLKSNWIESRDGPAGHRDVILLTGERLPFRSMFPEHVLDFGDPGSLKAGERSRDWQGKAGGSQRRDCLATGPSPIQHNWNDFRCRCCANN